MGDCLVIYRQTDRIIVVIFLSVYKIKKIIQETKLHKMMNKKHSLAIVWFRRDLRLRDNPALDFAIQHSREVILLYIYSPEEEKPFQIGAASKWWLHHSLTTLSSQIEKLGGKLHIRAGESIEVIENIVKEQSASLITWNRLFDPKTIERDKIVKQKLKDLGLEVESFSGATLLEPWELKTTTGGPYQVFTPFWRALNKKYTSTTPIPAPKTIATRNIVSTSIEKLKLLPKIKWDKDFYNTWTPGEQSAQTILSKFIKSKIKVYKEERDFPSIEASSTLSPHLHFGEISPKDIWFQCENGKNLFKNDIEPFIRQLAWRDFAHHLLFHFPHTTDQPLKVAFKKFPWGKDKKLLEAWKTGMTGFPLVDAGMRELWKTGTMHNRVRMLVGSILVKNFLINWIEGAKWFWDCLVDADLANNTLGWQWIGGCGADAAPYFRIFNPITQSEKFDKNGKYIRKWIPELSALPDKWIHKPWEAPKEVLESANIHLGKTYPLPVVDLKESREIALEAYFSLKT